MKEYTEGKKLARERIAVSVNCDGENMLLGIPTCISGTGKCQADAVSELLTNYELKNVIKGCVFDTTFTNTGKEKGGPSFLNSAKSQSIVIQYYYFFPQLLH